jgi:hypothetical protein
MPAHGPLSLVFAGAISIAGIAWTGCIFWAWRRSGADARRRGIRPDERTKLHLFQYRWTLASLAVSFGIGIYTNGIRPMVQGDSSWGFYAPAALTLLFVAMMTAVLGGAKRIAGAWLGMRFVQAASSTSNPLDFDSGSMSALEWMRLGEELIQGSGERASVKLGGRWVSVRAGGAPARDESTITPGALKNLLVQQQCKRSFLRALRRISIRATVRRQQETEANKCQESQNRPTPQVTGGRTSRHGVKAA